MNLYKKSGVDIEAGYESVKRIKKHTKKTFRKGCMGDIGEFGASFDISSLGVQNPVLVSSTDGVGTKIKIAFQLDKHDTIGIDCVAMCVNDIITQGAEPLYFLDYISLGKSIPSVVEEIVKGITDGCVQSNCALIGGETAEMPGLYKKGEYDLAGFSVGIVNKSNIIDGSKIQFGDSIIGIQSSGIHSNGFSLVRKVMKDNKLKLDKDYKGLNSTLGECILTPTNIYVSAILDLINKVNVKGISHITGGGFYENVPRMFRDKKLGASFITGNWEMNPIFDFLMKKGNVSKKEMFNVFNMGIGMMLVVSKDETSLALESLNKFFPSYLVGKVTLNGTVDII